MPDIDQMETDFHLDCNRRRNSDDPRDVAEATIMQEISFPLTQVCEQLRYEKDIDGPTVITAMLSALSQGLASIFFVVAKRGHAKELAMHSSVELARAIVADTEQLEVEVVREEREERNADAP